ncbi:glycosyltransferase family 2 protein [Pedobacter caeni]|uniref:Glycosyltransferase involved in cell wall bisynthesis n=1 Tax=Pedobacter caeni TaxID=288992 RepID=A0A1M5D2C7_9SPHI|nr:glycosyltransferase family 2 protein [Pedobacter caeni]SHF61193.1 Glycosyltransferase involved in cell wall bisynthesis [Pedobacter caeni]
MPQISLIISTYNWPEALKLCLLSVKQQTQLPVEVLIADDGSGPDTKSLIEVMRVDFPVPLVHIWHKDLGFRKSIIVNKAIKEASGDYIVQIDGDVILEKHFIKDHNHVAEKDVFVRGTRAHIHQDRLPELYRTTQIDFCFLSKGIINRFNAIRFPLLSFLFEKKKRNSNSVRGSNLAFWKSDYVLVNGYDNDLQGWGHEDEELAARFINTGKLKKGIKLRAVQFHLSHKEASRSNEGKHAEAVRNTLKNKLKTCINGYAQS